MHCHIGISLTSPSRRLCVSPYIWSGIDPSPDGLWLGSGLGGLGSYFHTHMYARQGCQVCSFVRVASGVVESERVV